MEFDLLFRWFVGQSWRRAWEHVVPLFGFPPDIRKMIYTTNAVESLNRSLRKIIKTRGSFPNDEAAMKLLYLARLMTSGSSSRISEAGRSPRTSPSTDT